MDFFFFGAGPVLLLRNFVKEKHLSFCIIQNYSNGFGSPLLMIIAVEREVGVEEGGRGGRHFFEDSWSHCVPQPSERATAKFSPHQRHTAPRRTSKITSMQPLCPPPGRRVKPTG